MELVEPAAVPRVVPTDPDDDQVIAAAVAVAAQAELSVSGDRDLLALGGYEEIVICPPAEALARITTA